MVRRGGRFLASAWALEAPRFASLAATGSATGADTFVPWTRADGRVVLRFYHLFADGEFPRLLEASGWGVARFFREEDNYFAEGVKDG